MRSRKVQQAGQADGDAFSPASSHPLVTRHEPGDPVRLGRASAAVGNPSERTRIVRNLYLEHHGRIVTFLRRLTTAERAEDFAQEVFFRLFQVKNLETREISVSYLFRIGENLVRKAYHKDNRRRRADHELRYRSISSQNTDGTSSAAAGARPDTEFKAVTHVMLQKALGCLTDREEAAVRLIVCRGLSYEQAASALDVNVTTINNWKHRGVKKLRQILAERASSGDRRGHVESSGTGDSPGGPGREGADPISNSRGGRSDDKEDRGDCGRRGRKLILRRA